MTASAKAATGLVRWPCLGRGAGRNEGVNLERADDAAQIVFARKVRRLEQTLNPMSSGAFAMGLQAVHL